MIEGQLTAKVLLITDWQRVSCKAENKVMGENLRKPLDSAIRSAGLLSSDYALTIIHPRLQKDIKTSGGEDIEAFRKLIHESQANVLVPMGEYALQMVTGLTSLSKWHCNVVKAKSEFGFRKCIPIFHPDHVSKIFSDSAYLGYGLQKVKEEMHDPAISIPARTFSLGPDYKCSLRALWDAANDTSSPIALDIETGGGLINTFGFATSSTEAVAIKTLPEFYTPEEHLEIWKAIAVLCESDRPKILQNFIYEAQWFSHYGIELKNVLFDTMWAMKFLHPEFEKGLHNVGRLYTPYPYWKDDNDDWANIRDWNRHLDYNCKDTTGTYAAWENQVKTLRDRGMYDLFQNYVMRFAPVIQEMCTTGLCVDTNALVALQEKLTTERDNYMRIIDAECLKVLGRTINPRSPQQVKQALKEMKMKLPIQKGKESTDKKALIKLRKKYPDASILQALIGLSKANKQLSSYVNFEYCRQTNRVRYALDGCGTETGRWSGYNSARGEGFNPQTVPKPVRNCFTADDGFVLVQLDLAQAESRYVAYESPEPKLMEMLENGQDVHKYVASEIFHKPEGIVNDRERQLGKKSGHAANYGVGARTFAEACLVEMDLAMEEREAARIISTYFQIFPGIRRRQENIRKAVYEKRVLRTPIGRERHFYGRMDDATFREAYAYAPQSVIPDITNHLMLSLWEHREWLGIDKFLLQVHDSLLIQMPRERVSEVQALAADIKVWHPKISLPGGELWIPVTVEAGINWGKKMVKL